MHRVQVYLTPSLTNAECFDFDGPKVAAFRQVTARGSGVLVFFSFTFVAISAVLALSMVKKERQDNIQPLQRDSIFLSLLSLTAIVEEKLDFKSLWPVGGCMTTNISLPLDLRTLLRSCS